MNFLYDGVDNNNKQIIIIIIIYYAGSASIYNSRNHQLTDLVWAETMKAVYRWRHRQQFTLDLSSRLVLRRPSSWYHYRLSWPQWQAKKWRRTVKITAKMWNLQRPILLEGIRSWIRFFWFKFSELMSITISSQLNPWIIIFHYTTWTIFRIKKFKSIFFFLSTSRNDRTKGCPFPTCTRYGRAFSRAHDLKRHIARHAMRKEKVLLVNQQKPDIENTISDATLQGTLLRGMEDKGGYLCPRCKKRYSDEDKLKAHLISHGKVLFH